MEVWNGIWKKILVWNEIWNGRFSVWNENGMEENCQYGIWKNRLPFHTMPWSLAPVLKLYDLNEKVTIQCDANKDGLGCAIMQNGQPMACDCN